MGEDMSCGWGIRTVSSTQPSFNPMSYHNGSVWPHDNALIAAGFRRYGFSDEANSVFTSIFEACTRFRYYRLPELYCGFVRDTRYHSNPAEYPVACSPQAWASGSIIHLLQTSLGLRADAMRGRLYIDPVLPEFIDEVELRNLRVADSHIDMKVRRGAVEVTRLTGRIEIVHGAHWSPPHVSRQDIMTKRDAASQI
jgi:glycogen debranching enzyme